MPGTVADCGQGVLYATQYGVWPLGKQVESESYDLARNVDQALMAILANAQAAYSPELGCWVLVNGTTTAWVSNVGHRPDVWTKFTLPQAAKSVYQGNGFWFGGTNGHIYKYDHDDKVDGTATAIATSLKTGNWNIEEPTRLKNIRYIGGNLNAGENATATVKLYVDGSGTASSTNAFTAGSRNFAHCNVNCHEVALEVTYTAPTAPCSFAGVSLDVELKGATK